MIGLPSTFNLPFTQRSNAGDANANISLDAPVRRENEWAIVPLKIVIRGSYALGTNHVRNLSIEKADGSKLASQTIKEKDTVWSANTDYTCRVEVRYNIGHGNAATITLCARILQASGKDLGTSSYYIWTDRNYVPDFWVDIPAVQKNPAVTDPANVSIKENGTAKFQVSASGGYPETYSYQWQWRSKPTDAWVNGSGDTSASIVVPAIRARNGYQYRCGVINTGGKWVYSNPATLTVYYPPSAQQASVTEANEGGSSTLRIGYTDGNPTSSTFRWQISYDQGKTWSALPGTTASYNYGSLNATHDDALVRCLVGNAQYSSTSEMSTSATAKLTVYSPPSIVEQPQLTFVMEGETARISLKASGRNPVECLYQWCRSDVKGNTTDIPGQTQSALTIDNCPVGLDHSLYRCKVGNSKFLIDSTPTISSIVKLRVRSYAKSPAVVTVSSPVSAGAVNVSWNDGSDGKENPLVGYIIHCCVKPSGASSFVRSAPCKEVGLAKETTIDLKDLDIRYGDTVAFFVQAVGEFGVNPKEAILPIPGSEVLFGGIARVRVDGESKMALVYVRVDGAWKQAIPNVMQNGVWTITG